MKTFSEFAAESAGETLFGMANLSPKRTGPPFLVWIFPKTDASHVHVKISRSPKAHSSELISVALRPDVRVVGGGRMSTRDLALLRKWVEVNYDVILKYWGGEIEYTEDAIAALKPLP